MAVIPPWLNPPDIAGEYSRGLQLGVSIQDAQNKLAQAQDEAQMQAQIRAKTAADEHEKEQAQIAAQAAYHTAQTGLAQQRLDQEAAKQAAAQKQLAAKVAAGISYGHDLQATKPDGTPLYTGVQALTRNPLVLTPAAVESATKMDRDHWAESLDLKRQKEDRLAADNNRALTLREQALTDKENRQGKIGTMDAPYMHNPDGSINVYGPKATLPMDSPAINSLMGTNAPPGVGTNFPGRTLTPPPMPAPAAAVQGAPDVQAAAPAAPAGPVTPKSQAEFDNLPEGTLFINPKDGQVRRKKAFSNAPNP